MDGTENGGCTLEGGKVCLEIQCGLWAVAVEKNGKVSWGSL